MTVFDAKEIDQAALTKVLSMVQDKKLVRFDFDPYAVGLILTFEDGGQLEIAATNTEQITK